MLPIKLFTDARIRHRKNHAVLDKRETVLA
ncbi:Uncharacterised protein [Vibrio cholerae]|nr:Uncharacterised protein [Vibrio cholerae]